MTKVAAPSEQQQETALRARVFGKFITLDADPAESEQVIRTAIPFQLKSLDDETRTIEFIGSTATKDRYGDVIVQSGWELANFVRNPVIPWGHDYGMPPVAKAVEVGIREEGLFFRAQFASADEYAWADTIYKLYKGGYLRAFSVGFIPKEWEMKKDEEGYAYFVFTKCELLEVSCVTVPANPDALTLAFDEGVLSDRDKTLMVKQAKKLIKALTPEEDSSINKGMSEEQFSELKSVIGDLGESIKALQDEVSKLKAAPEPQAGEEDDDTAKPPAQPDGGTEAKAIDTAELKSVIGEATRSALDYELGKV